MAHLTRNLLRCFITVTLLEPAEAVLNCVGGSENVVYREAVNVRLAGNKPLFMSYLNQVRDEDCARKCTDYSTWECKSFEYNPSTMVCIIYPYTATGNGVQSAAGWILHYDPWCSEGTHPPGHTTRATTSSAGPIFSTTTRRTTTYPIRTTTTTLPPNTTSSPTTESQVKSVLALDDEYIVLIGMGIVVILLLVVIIVTLCHYGNNSRYKFP